MAKGNISVHTDNLLPIIKKWLYSDSDIFVRELVSNAQDAIMKLKKLTSLGEADIADCKYEILISVDKNAGTLKIIDNGIGMTEEEVEKYINQVAFSGAEEFLSKYSEEKNEDNRIIGHFGLGFYSAFMASKEVEIDTLSYVDKSKAVHWVSDGGTEYEITDSTRTERGTEITLHLSEEFKEYLEVYKIRETLTKYCGFLPVEIYLTDDISDESKKQLINDTNPLWLKNPSECTDEDYKAFYHKVFFDMNDPLFWIHLNVDFPFNLKGILYFPKLNHEFQSIEGQIKLYNNQVFIADNIKEVTPEYLMLLKGMIDCPDLPLNVSRSFLQNDGYVTKVSSHITKKIADKLNSLYKTEKESFEKYWDDINPFIKYGCLRDEKFYDRIKDIIIFKKLDDTYVSLKELTEGENKEVYYVTDIEAQNQYIDLIKTEGMEPVLLNNFIDNHFSSFLEYKISDIKFRRVDSFIADSIKNKASDDTNDDELKKIFSQYIKEDNIVIESLKSDKISAMFILSEEARRMEEMQKMYGGMNIPNMPKPEETFVLNRNNALIKKLLNTDNDKLKELIALNVVDMAKLSHNTLNGDDRTRFIERNSEIMNMLFE